MGIDGLAVWEFKAMGDTGRCSRDGCSYSAYSGTLTTWAHSEVSRVSDDKPHQLCCGLKSTTHTRTSMAGSRCMKASPHQGNCRRPLSCRRHRRSALRERPVVSHRRAAEPPASHRLAAALGKSRMQSLSLCCVYHRRTRDSGQWHLPRLRSEHASRCLRRLGRLTALGVGSTFLAA